VEMLTEVGMLKEVKNTRKIVLGDFIDGLRKRKPTVTKEAVRLHNEFDQPAACRKVNV